MRWNSLQPIWKISLIGKWLNRAWPVQMKRETLCAPAQQACEKRSLSKTPGEHIPGDFSVSIHAENSWIHRAAGTGIKEKHDLPLRVWKNERPRRETGGLSWETTLHLLCIFRYSMGESYVLMIPKNKEKPHCIAKNGLTVRFFLVFGILFPNTKRFFNRNLFGANT